MPSIEKQFKNVEPQPVSCSDCMHNSRNGLNVCLRYGKPCNIIRDYCIKSRYYFQMCIIKGAVAAEVKKASGNK